MRASLPLKVSSPKLSTLPNGATDWASISCWRWRSRSSAAALGAIAYVRTGSTTEHLAATLQRAIDARARLAQVEYS